MALNAKQTRFVAEYLKDLNATQAAIRAGYSIRSAHAIASENLTKPAIAAIIAEQTRQRLASTELSATRTLEEIRRVGYSDIRKVFTKGGHLRDITELSDEEAAAVSSVEVTRQRRSKGQGEDADIDETLHKIKLWDKMKALDLAARHFKLLTDRIEVVDADDLMARLAAGRARVKAAKPVSA